MGNTFYFEWEVALMEWAQAALPAFILKMAEFWSLFGTQYVLVGVFGGLYWCYDKELGKHACMCMTFAGILNPMAKNIALRRRPYMDFPSIKCLQPIDASADIMDINAQGYSFPSGHATSSSATYCSIAERKHKKWLTWVAVILTILVAISRPILGVHYPTDIIFGTAMGLAIVFVFPWLRTKFKTEFRFHLALIAICAPGLFYCKTNDYFTFFGMFIGFAFGILYEVKYVNFERAKNWKGGILRFIGGVAIYFVLNEILKLPFSAQLLAGEDFLAHMIRLVRYAIVAFTIAGPYTKLFRK